MAIFFIIFFFLALLLEGVGLPQGRIGSYWLLVIGSLITAGVLWRRQSLNVPKTPLFALSGFLFFSFLSTLFSDDFELSLLTFLLWGACSLGFFCAYSLRDRLEKPFAKLLIVIACVLPLYSIIARNYLFSFFSFVQPVSGYQMVIPYFGLHNHMGDFLVLVIALCLFSAFLEKKATLLFSLVYLLLFPFVLFSFSRSAYIVLFLVMVWTAYATIKAKKHSVILYAALGILLTGVILFFMATTVRSTVLLSLPQKTVLNHIEFPRQAVVSFLEKPLFGVGPGAFIFASNKYNMSRFSPTDSAHNIFLDVLSEQGIFAFLYFVWFVLFILRMGEKRNIYFFLFCVLLLLFQTDYFHRLYSIQYLLFILAGLSLPKKLPSHTV